MNSLTSRTCEACRVGAPRATQEEIDRYMPQLPDWELVQEEETDRLRRKFAFADFRKALQFANRVGEIAEEEGHHPALLVEWGAVTVSWWTHKIGGLHVNDFIMAAKTDALL